MNEKSCILIQISLIFFLRLQLIISLYWLGQWLVACSVPSHYLNQCSLSSLTHRCVTHWHTGSMWEISWFLNPKKCLSTRYLWSILLMASKDHSSTLSWQSYLQSQFFLHWPPMWFPFPTPLRCAWSWLYLIYYTIFNPHLGSCAIVVASIELWNSLAV